MRQGTGSSRRQCIYFPPVVQYSQTSVRRNTTRLDWLFASADAALRVVISAILHRAYVSTTSPRYSRPCYSLVYPRLPRAGNTCPRYVPNATDSRRRAPDTRHAA
eukprot:2752125-Pleurochrysis_carterae.AAC.1